MFSRPLHRLDRTARHALPLLSVIIVLTIEALPWPWEGVVALGSNLVLMAVYYWVLYRPDLFTPITVFLIGLMVDAIGGLPLGLSALGYLILFSALMKLRNLIANHPFFMLWAGFAATVLCFTFWQWLGLCLLHGEVMALSPGLINSLLASLLFPAVAALLIMLHRLVGVADE